MKLAALAEQGRQSTTTLKYWIRAGLLPAGKRLNATTADYDVDHLHRIELITLLRERFDTPIAAIRRLTRQIDDPTVPEAWLMGEAQSLALGLRADEDGGSDWARGVVDEVCEQQNWPSTPSYARAELARTVDALVTVVGPESFPDYRPWINACARALASIAQTNIASFVTGPTRNQLATQVIRGTALQVSMERAMSALAHTSASILRYGRRDSAAPGS